MKINTRQDVANLIGEKATYFIVNEWGLPVSRQVTITDVRISSYAQYAEALCIWYREPKQRKDRGFWVLPYKDFAIWKGWVNINANPVERTTQGEHFTMEHYHTSFSPIFMQNAMADCPPPVYAQSDRI